MITNHINQWSFNNLRFAAAGKIQGLTKAVSRLEWGSKRSDAPGASLSDLMIKVDSSLIYVCSEKFIFISKGAAIFVSSSPSFLHVTQSTSNA
jgi:hypothetical protein